MFFYQTSFAYDPCEVENSFNSQAQSECFYVLRPLGNTDSDETEFKIRAVLLSSNLSLKGSKDTLVIVPGGPGNDSEAIRASFNLKDILNAFWRHDNLNVGLFDPRGTGASQFLNPAEEYSQHVFSTEHQILDLKAVVENLSPNKPVILLAHSAGGGLAARLAADYPHLVKGLILYSASIDTREIGESNLRIFADHFSYWDDFIKSQQRSDSNVNSDELTELTNQRLFIESFLKNVLKLQRLTDYSTSSLNQNLYLKNFRLELILALENHSENPNRLTKTLDKWHSRILALPKNTFDLVQAQDQIQFDLKNYKPLILRRSDWIKTAVICSEGLTKDEMNYDLWLEGFKFFEDTCQLTQAIYKMPPSRDWLKKIDTPTLLIGGSEDPYQIKSAVLRNAGSIKNSEVHIFDKAGHEAHLTHSWKFYSLISDFVNKLSEEQVAATE